MLFEVRQMQIPLRHGDIGLFLPMRAEFPIHRLNASMAGHHPVLKEKFNAVDLQTFERRRIETAVQRILVAGQEGIPIRRHKSKAWRDFAERNSVDGRIRRPAVAIESGQAAWPRGDFTSRGFDVAHVHGNVVKRRIRRAVAEIQRLDVQILRLQHPMVFRQRHAIDANPLAGQRLPHELLPIVLFLRRPVRRPAARQRDLPPRPVVRLMPHVEPRKNGRILRLQKLLLVEALRRKIIPQPVGPLYQKFRQECRKWRILRLFPPHQNARHRNIDAVPPSEIRAQIAVHILYLPTVLFLHAMFEFT